MSKPFTAQKLIIIAIIAIVISFLLPMLVNGFDTVFLQTVTDTSKGFSSALLRTLIFALLSSVINCTGGLFLALLLKRIPFFQNWGRQLSYFILPVTLGNVAIAYIFKISLYGTAFFDSIITGGYATQTAAILCIQFWQYGFLFAYLFWIGINNIPDKINNYSVAIKHSRYERLKDIILPNIKNLFILLFFISFAFSFYEDAKNQFIFKTSQGMNTELISQVFARTYQSNLIINTGFANSSVFSLGMFTFVAALLVIVLTGAGIFFIFKLLQENKLCFKAVQKLQKDEKTNPTVAICCLITIITPVLIALIKSKYSFSINILSEITMPFLLTLISALLATMLAVYFGISSRLIFKKWLGSFNSKSMWYFISVFLLQFIPPVCIVICGFQWLSWIGYNSLIYVVWILGHCILVFPVLGSFIVATHFAVKQTELDYLSVQNIPTRNIMQFSFIKLFKAEYILTLLFAFTFIWNDTTLNMILSDKIPSFAKQLQILFIGRGANYSTAAIYVLIAVAISILCVMLWQSVIKKAAKNNIQA
jgi:ABC-type sugar transport system permease subunit